MGYTDVKAALDSTVEKDRADRAPVAFHKHHRDFQNDTKKRVLPRNLSIVLHSPLKIPVPKWNIEALRPYSDYSPIGLADFSSRLPTSTLSDSTAEGTHIRCFRRLLIWRSVREDRPYTAREIGRTMLKYHAKTLDALDRTERPFWKGGPSGCSTMATWPATSPLSMTSWRAYWRHWTGPPHPARMWCRTGSIIWATTAPNRCCALSV